MYADGYSIDEVFLIWFKMVYKYIISYLKI